MVDFNEIQERWKKVWEEKKVFEAQPESGKPKFFLTFPYPYLNGYLHVGHTYTLMRGEALARYKRMRGFNVLWPQGWHATGSPIDTAAKRVREGEEKQIEILKLMGFSDEEIERFKEPEHWIKVFRAAATEDYKNFGVSIDWRRSFITTDMNPHYSKFIQWQFRKLKEGNYIGKGKHPVVWCPKENGPVGDHARAEGEGETPKDFIWPKFRMKDSDLILMAGTTRPDALLGQTHLWIDPDATYKIVKVNDEKWVVGEEAVKKIEEQYAKAEVIGDIHSTELMGKWVKGPIVDYDIYIVPAWFIDANVGSGIVYSALEDPVDLIECRHIQENPDVVKKYNLDMNVVSKLKPISIIDVPGMGDDLGDDIAKEFKITSPKEKDKVKKAKDELNKRVFRKGIMKESCGKYAGMTVPQAQEVIKKEIIESNDAVMFYELTGKVICRCLTECVVKVVENQWFLKYGDHDWKQKVKKALGETKLYPEKVRLQFENVVDWLNDWACTREFGLGTKLPWDEKWVIESLSDSTLYNAYYTFVHMLQEIPLESIDDELFDYIMLEKDDAQLKIDKELAQKMRAEFEYWYPVDFRNSGKDLVQNHLTFYLFNHTAVFPEKYWPRGIGVNGFVNIEKMKMSKSKGNFKTLRQLYEAFTPDVTRITILSSGEELADVDWDSDAAYNLKNRLEQWHDFAVENYGNGSDDVKEIDKWFESKINAIIKETAEAMDETLYRTAIQKGYFDTQRALKWYMKRRANNPNKELLKRAIEVQTKLLAPFTPYICEEVWKNIGKETLIAQESWPNYDENKINPQLDAVEGVVQQVIDDVNAVLKIAKITKPSKITLLVADTWKYTFVDEIKKVLEHRNPGVIIKELMQHDALRIYGKDISNLVPKIVKDPSKLPSVTSNQDSEHAFLEDAKDFLETNFDCAVEVVKAQESKEQKAKQAMPAKPAILVA